jgi:hypothetical protein
VESSILSEVDDTSILRTGLATPLWPSSQLATASRLLPREAGWSAATLCVGTEEMIDWTWQVVRLLGQG